MSRHRQYPRTARLNEVVREVVAEELERLSDPRLALVTVTGVEVSSDLKQARVYYSALEDGFVAADGSEGAAGAEAEDVPSATEESGRSAANALESARRHLQAALGRQVRLKYVPRLVFEEDPAIITGRRIDDIIRHLHDESEPPEEPEETSP